MKLFRIDLSKILMVALMIFFVFGMVRNGFATKVEIVQGHLLVNGEPLTIKGVNYSPIPIGVDPEITSPYGDYFTPNYSPIYERDLPLLRQMGANTIRLWAWNNGNGHTDFLDKAYDNGVKPLYVIITFSMDPSLYPDISSPDAKKKIKADFRAMVAAYKSHPAVLMWSIGNELNVPRMYGDKLGDLFSLIDEMAHEAHKEEGAHYHPVTTPLADIDLINTIATYEPLMTDIDIWGANIYRGSSFGTVFNDLKKESTKPFLVTGFGIDAYDESASDEYENIGIPYQATYAESLWKEISANLDVCLGGAIRAYSDEWWLGKFGNTLGGCPDLNAAFHSPCGHPSSSDPDGFVNYEWFGIMRVAKNGSDLDIMEPRKVYHTLKSLWTENEISIQSQFQSQSVQKETLIEAESKVPVVSLSVKPLDLTRTPTVEEIMAAGQLGGQLYPTHEMADKIKEKKINLSFGDAIQAWNKHEYKEAVQRFKKHVEEYPDSPWASEAVLHVGCDAYYNGRHTEAEEGFKWILENNKGKAHEGAKRLLNKARARLAILKVYQNNFKEATEHFTTLKKEGLDWRDRTYASAWIQRLSLFNSHKLAMLNCGTRALAYLLEKDGKEAEARKVIEFLPETTYGHSIKALSDIASRYGYNVVALRISISDLKNLPLPSIMHMNGKNQGDSGHYWMLDKVNGDTLELFDPQSGFRFQQSLDEFSKEWNGNALVFSDSESLPGIRLAENEMEQYYGGCCGAQRSPGGLGDPGRNQGQGNSGNKSPCGSPVWSVNMVTINLYVNDIPLWYNSTIGPSVGISLSYNSQSAISYNEPFGNKWQLNYASYLTVDTGGNVTIFMPDGRRDVYSKITGGYNHPYQVFNTLTKIAENHFELKFPDNTVYVFKIPPGTSSLQPFLVEIRDFHNQKLTFGYDSSVRLTTITDALGRITTLIYNAQGLVTKATDPFGRFATFEYDANRNLIKITDIGGYASSLSYDQDVYLTSIEKPGGGWGFYIEPADGVVAYSDDYGPPGAPMWQSYRVTITNPLGDKEEYFYHGGCGSAVGINTCGYSWYISPKDYVPYASGSVNNFRSAPKMVYYLRTISSQGEISKIADPDGRLVSYGYDYSTGSRTSIQDGNGNTTSLVYDTKGNITSIIDPLGNKVQFNYDSNNNLTKLTDPAGNIYNYEYNGKDLTKITDPKNGVTTFTYNSFGKLTQLKDAKNSSITFAYDSYGNLMTATNPLGGVDRYTFDAVGRIISYTDPKGNTKSFNYDGINRLTKVTYPGGSEKNYTYDCCALSTITDSNGTSTFTYDDLRRLTTFADTYGKTISYGYDKAGNLTNLIYPDGKIVRYEYDKAGRLIKVKDWLNNVAAYEYDSIGNLSRTAYPDGSIIVHKYDNANRLKSILDYKADATINATFNYTIDSLGNRTTVSFYQPLNAIPSEPNINYTYDADNRLLTAEGTTFSYDNNGNLISKTVESNVSNYSWDYNNMLTQVVGGGNTYGYKYDGLGNRIARVESGVEKRYVVDPSGSLSQVLAETDLSGNITGYYVYGLGLISKITSSGQVYYYHYDGIGSTIALTDLSGDIVNKYAYDAFGDVLSQEETIPNSFKYVGRFGVTDEGNGLLYMRARYYDPKIGRFINKDPMGSAGGLNVYSYTGDNPINWVDPLGLLGIAFFSNMTEIDANGQKWQIHGYYDPATNIISLDSELSTLDLASTFVHELAHYFFPCVEGIAIGHQFENVFNAAIGRIWWNRDVRERIWSNIINPYE